MGVWVPGPGATSGNDTFVGDSNWETVSGLAGNDVLLGNGGRDTLNGGDGADRIDGGSDYNLLSHNDFRGEDNDPDELIGGIHDDVLEIGIGDSADGGSANGTDRLFANLSGLTAGVALDLSADPATVTAQLASLLGATLANIEAFGVLGTNFDDNIKSDSYVRTFFDNFYVGMVDGGGGNDILTAAPNAGAISGLGGSVGGGAWLFGGDGSDTLIGSAQHDVLFANGSLTGYTHFTYSASDWRSDDGDADTITAGDGNDNVYIGLGDAADGGAGASDRIHATLQATSQGVVLDLSGDANAALSAAVGAAVTNFEIFAVRGTEFNDTITGEASANLIIGGDGNDTLTVSGASISGAILDGGHGDDTFNSGAGNDTIYTGGGQDQVSAGDGNDIIYLGFEYQSVDGQVRIFNSIVDGGSGEDYVGVGSYPHSSSQYESLTEFHCTTLINVEVADGNINRDWMIDDDGGHTLNGMMGDDHIEGRGGDDTLLGWWGNDYIEGGDGNDNIDGGSHDDILLGGDGNDAITGGGGHDVLEGGGGFDILTGHGASLLEGGAGADVLIGYEGDTARYTGSGSEVVVRLWNGSGQGGDAEGDALVGILNVIGSAHGDALVGSTARNRLEGGEGNDYLDGLQNDDTLRGGGGDDVLVGGAHRDALDGGDGDDMLVGGSGSDTLEGGAGFDVADYSSSSSRVVVRLWNGTGELGDAQGDILTGIEKVSGSAQADALIGSNGADILSGGAGADHLDGLEGSDTADYSSSSGRVVVRLWNGTGQQGDAEGDTLIGIENLSGSAHNDALIGSDAANILSGGIGADYLDGLGGSDTADYSSSSSRVVVRLWNGTGQQGDAQGDALTGIENLSGSSHDDSLIGSDGANILTGGTGNDYLDGLEGADTLNGGGGTDALVGGTGGDRFVFDAALSDGIDVIDDFEAGSDKLVLDGKVFSQLTAGPLAASAFRIGSAAQDADDRIVYDSASGAMFYDADGSGASAAVQFAALDAGLTLAASDIEVSGTSAPAAVETAPEDDRFDFSGAVALQREVPLVGDQHPMSEVGLVPDGTAFDFTGALEAAGVDHGGADLFEAFASMSRLAALGPDNMGL
jgi:Ca2+-binding RTX toxin-like protein